MGLSSPVPGITVLDTLAYGGFAVVYRARQESVGREVALKVDNRLAHDDRDRRRFLREAHAAGRLSDHPNVISIYDAGITPDGHPYLVMELCPGGSLAERVKKTGPLPPAEVREIGVKIADALESAHQAGVLHRDVKPANVLVNRFGSPGLADFGMAASFEGAQQLSATLEALTPAFAPPEVFRHEVPTPAVDVYGLAATLYCLLSGRPARWPAEGHPSIATIIGLQEEPVPDIPGVPAALTAVLRRSLSPAPEDRHPSAVALRDALQGVALEAPTGMFVMPAESRRARHALESADASAPERAARRGRHLAAVSAAATELAAESVAVAPESRPADPPSRGGTRRLDRPEAPVEGVNPPRRRLPTGPPPPDGATTVRRRPDAPPAPAVPHAPVWPWRSLGPTQRIALVAAVAAAVLGVVAAYAVNSRSHPQPTPIAAPAGQVVAPSPATSLGPPAKTEPSADPSPVAAKPSPPPPRPQQPAPPAGGADVLTSAGLPPFRLGDPAAPLLQSNAARQPAGDTGCDPASELISTDARFSAADQRVSAHTVDGRIEHVTVYSNRVRASGGLRIGSSIVDITSVAPQAQQFGSIAPSFLVPDGGNALLFVVRNGEVMAIMAGPAGQLSSIAETLGRAPTDLTPLC